MTTDYTMPIEQLIDPKSLTFRYHVSSIEGARNPQFAFIAQSFVSDETITDVMFRNFSDIRNIFSYVENFVESSYGKVTIENNSKIHEAVVNDHKFLWNVKSKDAQYVENFVALIQEMGNFVRCCVNDIIYEVFFHGSPVAVERTEERSLQNCFIASVSVFERCIRSLRDTLKYFQDNNPEWVKIDAVGKVEFTNGELKTMFNGLLKIFVSQLLFTSVNCEYNFSHAVEGYGSMNPSVFTASTVQVVEAVFGIYSKSISQDESEEPEEFVVAKIEKIISLLTGIQDASSITRFCEKTIRLAASKQKMKAGIEKEIMEAQTGELTGRTKSTSRINRAKTSQRSMMANPKMRTIIEKKMMGGTLSSRVKQREENVGNGHVYALIDATGSTLHSKGETLPLALLFETIALSVADVAIASKRNATIFFYCEQVVKTVSFRYKDSYSTNREKKRELMCNAVYLGNNEYVVLQEVVEQIKRDRSLSKGKEPVSLFFLSDGMMLTAYEHDKYTKAQQMRLELENLQQEIGLRILPVLIYEQVDRVFNTIFEGKRFMHIRKASDFDVPQLEEILRFSSDLTLSALK